MALKTTASVSTGTEFALLDADIYDATLVAIAVRPFQVFEGKPGEMQDKYIFIYQIPQESGEPRYLKSAPLAITINEKSNLYAKHLKALSGGKSETDFGNGYDPSVLIGTQVRLEVEQQKSKKDGKTYNEIVKAIGAGKAKISVEAGKIPEFFIKGSTEYEMHASLRIAKDESAPDAAVAGMELDNIAETVGGTDQPRKRPAPIA